MVDIMKNGRNLFVFFYVFSLFSLIIIPIIDFNTTTASDLLGSIQIPKEEDFGFFYELTNSIDQMGTGSNLVGEEYPFNSSNKQGYVNGNFINMPVPASYSGKSFWVKIENLTANRTANSIEYADNAVINQGTWNQGTVDDTNTSDGVYYQVDDQTGANGIHLDFEFNINGILKSQVTSIFWYVRGRRQLNAGGGQNVDIRIWNYTSSSYEKNGTVSSQLSWGTYSGTVIGNDCFSDSNPVTLNFYSSNSPGNFIQLDYVYIRIYYQTTFESVYPETINFRVLHDSTNYPITSSNGNQTTISGNIVGPSTETFTFLSDSPSNFDFEYTFILNKSKSAYSYYFLANNELVKNTWKVNYSVDSIPSGYDKLNFTLQLPKNWEYLNTTAPNGNDHSGYTTTDSSGDYLSVSVDSDAVDLFKSELPTNWSIWANSSNYINQIQFFQYPDYATPMSSPIIYNLTDNMTIKCPLTGATDSPSSANLTIFNSTNHIVHQELDVDVSGSTIVFTDWNTSKFNSNGEFIAQVTWFNGTQIGFRNATFSCVYPTILQMVYPDENEFDWGANRTLEVTVRYYNTYNGKSVSGAANAEYIWDGNSPQSMVDKGDGTYNLTDTDTDRPDGYVGDLYINVSKYGYHNITNYHIIVNIVNDTELTLLVENFTGSYFNTTYISSYYPENITITANYTQLWVTTPNPLDDAIVNVSIDGNYIADLIPKPGQPGFYYIYLNSSDHILSPLDIGKHEIKVSAWKNGYYGNEKNFTWEIYETSTNINSNQSSYFGYGGTPFTIRVYYNDTYHNYFYNITDANFTITYGPTHKVYDLYTNNITNYANGSYDLTLVFNIYNVNDNFQMNITANRSGYQSQWVLIDLDIWVYNTSIVYLTYPSEIPLYENQTIQIGFNRTDFGDGIPPDIEIEINQTYGVMWQNITDAGNYTITLITQRSISNINASVQYVNITINKTNYEVNFIPIVFQIRENRTFANISECIENWHFTKFEDRGNYYHMDIHLNRTIDIFINYTNNETGSKYNLKNETSYPIDVTAKIYNSSSGDYIGDFNVSEFGNRQFNITIISSAYDLPIGDYFLNISFKKFNHQWAFVYINVSIIPWESTLIPWSQTEELTLIPQWEGQFVTFNANLSKLIFNASDPRNGIVEIIDNSSLWEAVVNFTIKDLNNQTIRTGTNLTYISSIGLWELVDQFQLLNDLGNQIPPGNYKIWLNSTAKNIAPMSNYINLKVLEHLSSGIFILSQPTVSESGTILLQMSFTVNGTNYGDENMERTVIFHLILLSDGGLVPLDIAITTDYQGSYSLMLPAGGLKSIIYWAEFSGVNNSYPQWSIKSTVSAPMAVQVTSIWDFLIWILIAAGVTAVIVPTLYVINRKVRVKRQSKIMDEAEKTFDYFSDLISLRKVYLIHKKEGTAMYQQNYNMADFNEFTNKALISMINGFGKGRSGYDASLDLIRFQDLYILIDDGELVRSAFILSKLPSKKFIKGIVRFVQIFEINHYNILKEDGKFTKKHEVEELLDYIFEISIILPYKVTMKGMNMKLNAFRTQMVMTAYESQTDGYFFIADLYNKVIADTMMPELMIFKEISYLINKRAFILYSLKTLKAEGKEIKYISVEEQVPSKEAAKLKAPTVEKTPKEEYITPVTAQIVEDYELPEPSLSTEVAPRPIEAVGEDKSIEELEEQLGEKTPLELMMEKEFQKPKVTETPKPEKIEKIVPEKPEISTVKEIPKETKPVAIKPVTIKPVQIKTVKIKPIKTIPIKPIVQKPVVEQKKPVKTIKAEPKITKAKPSKLIEISVVEKKQLDKSILNLISDTNKLISSLDNLEGFIGKSVKDILEVKKKVDINSSEIEKSFAKQGVVFEKEILGAKNKAKESAELVEKLLLTLIEIEKEIEKSDKEFDKISKEIKKVEKKLNKQPKEDVMLELRKIESIREKMVDIDEKLGKSLEIRERFDEKINESAKKVEVIDDLVKSAEKKVISAKEKLKQINKDIEEDIHKIQKFREKRLHSRKELTELERKEGKLINFLIRAEDNLKLLKDKTKIAEDQIKDYLIKKLEPKKTESGVVPKKPIIPKVTLEKSEIPPPKLPETEETTLKNIEKPVTPEAKIEIPKPALKPTIPKEEIDEEGSKDKKIEDVKGQIKEKISSAKPYDMKPHCPVCSKILEERELILLKKGFSPECPACGSILNPKDFEL